MKKRQIMVSLEEFFSKVADQREEIIIIFHGELDFIRNLSSRIELHALVESAAVEIGLPEDVAKVLKIEGRSVTVKDKKRRKYVAASVRDVLIRLQVRRDTLIQEFCSNMEVLDSILEKVLKLRKANKSQISLTPDQAEFFGLEGEAIEVDEE